MTLSLTTVQLLANRLDEAGIRYASGGSGLLYSLGLSDSVRDWDLTTDASYEEVALALKDWSWTVSPSGDHPFASSYRISIADEQLPIDIIGRFAIYSENGICRLPAVYSFEWQYIRMGSPEIWAAAYFLMGRKAKADMLLTHLREQGANRDILQKLMIEPLPDSLRFQLHELL